MKMVQSVTVEISLFLRKKTETDLPLQRYHWHLGLINITVSSNYQCALMGFMKQCNMSNVIILTGKANFGLGLIM